jgi:cytochrome d ubiquinol oxidase subunit I
MRTSEAVSPVAGSYIAISLTAFVITYAFVFGAGVYYILHLINKGPASEEEAYGAHGVKKPPIVTKLVAGEGGGHA